MKNIIILLMFVSLCGCSSRTSSGNSLYELFEQQTNLSGMELPISTDSISDPYFMELHNEYIYLVDMNRPYIITVINSANGHVNRAVHRGRGESEMLWAIDINVSDTTLVAYDNSMKSLYCFESKNGIIYYDNPTKIQLSTDNSSPFRCVSLHGGGYVATGVTNDLSQFIVYDTDGSEINMFEEYPVDPKSTNNPNSNPFGYQGHIASAENTRGFAWGSSNGLIFKFFKACDNTMTKINEHIIEYPIFSGNVNENGAGAMFSKGNMIGTISAKSSGGKYYFLCSGMVEDEKSRIEDIISGDIVLVFDAEGNPIESFRLDRRIRLFDIDEQNHHMICYTVDGVTGLPKLFCYNI